MDTCKDPKLAYHWAYKRDAKSSLNGKLRRHIHEHDHPGWAVVAARAEDEQLAHKIMKFDGMVAFEGVRYRVLFLEVWYFYGDELYMVRNLFNEVEGEKTE